MLYIGFVTSSAVFVMVRAGMACQQLFHTASKFCENQLKASVLDVYQHLY